MKGLFLQAFYGSRLYLAGAAALSIAFAVALPILMNAMSGDSAFASIALQFPLVAITFVVIVLPLEGVSNNFSKNVINKFSAFSVTAMTPVRFSICIYIQFVAAILIGVVLCVIPLASLAVFCESFGDMALDCIKIAVVVGAFMLAVEYIVASLIIKLKNRDKAAFVCIGIGFATGLIASLIVIISEIEIDSAYIMSLIGDYWYIAALGLPIVLFPVGFALMLRMIKRGELA